MGLGNFADIQMLDSRDNGLLDKRRQFNSGRVQTRFESSCCRLSRQRGEPERHLEEPEHAIDIRATVYIADRAPQPSTLVAAPQLGGGCSSCGGLPRRVAAPALERRARAEEAHVDVREGHMETTLVGDHGCFFIPWQKDSMGIRRRTVSVVGVQSLTLPPFTPSCGGRGQRRIDWIR
jgi:hypothetical protein